jgi:methyltransferase family protein
MFLKSVVRKCLPSSIVQRIAAMRQERREQRLSQLTVEQAFDEVYRKKLWKRGCSASGPGSEGYLADRYVELIREYAERHNLRTAVDGGCGDFEVGSRIAPIFDRYLALDVSPRIIGINKRRYDALTKRNVTFAVADLMAGPLPSADLVLIRQVLQHLSNAQIVKILANLESSIWRRVLVTEEVPHQGSSSVPNLDLSSHSAGTRVALGSGVYIDRAPFGVPAKRIASIECAADIGQPAATLVVFEISRDSESIQRMPV